MWEFHKEHIDHRYLFLEAWICHLIRIMNNVNVDYLDLPFMERSILIISSLISPRARFIISIISLIEAISKRQVAKHPNVITSWHWFRSMISIQWRSGNPIRRPNDSQRSISNQKYRNIQ